MLTQISAEKSDSQVGRIKKMGLEYLRVQNFVDLLFKVEGSLLTNCFPLTAAVH